MLSGGERNRLNLALTLKMGGNLLLLDEPTNDLDVETLQSLEDALLEFPGCAVVISHDRWFLDRVATHILSWEGDDEEQAKWFWFEGNYADYEANKIARLGAEAASFNLPSSAFTLSLSLNISAYSFATSSIPPEFLYSSSFCSASLAFHLAAVVSTTSSSRFDWSTICTSGE